MSLNKFQLYHGHQFYWWRKLDLEKAIYLDVTSLDTELSHNFNGARY